MITDEERKRYARQILMIGEEGQERLKDASVLKAPYGELPDLAALIAYHAESFDENELEKIMEKLKTHE